ncbi:hypothetical protein K4K61_012710 [Colletotrichum sp. SAR11_59]|nr:hypothetical protein K4K61_012710 [Colletotrichum sp. SAR11_59]
MVVVAVAGATGGIGRAIVEAIQQAGTHDVIIFSRKANPTLASELNVPIIEVDYADVEATTGTLEKHNVHTLISALTTTQSLKAQDQIPEIQLIQAADAAKATRRFVPSDWGIALDEGDRDVLFNAGFKLDSRKALEETTDLEHTSFHNGFFLDYWCMPAVKSHMTPWTVVVDMASNAAVLPGSGNVNVTFTHTSDVGRYVAAWLDVREWEPRTFLVGDTVTWNQFLAIAEDVKGTKFSVKYEGDEVYRSAKATILPSQKAGLHWFSEDTLQTMLSSYMLLFDQGRFDLSTRSSNAQFPEIKPMKVREALEKAWARRRT